VRFSRCRKASGRRGQGGDEEDEQSPPAEPRAHHLKLRLRAEGL
jgi:hypothetical protein